MASTLFLYIGITIAFLNCRGTCLLLKMLKMYWGMCPMLPIVFFGYFTLLMLTDPGDFPTAAVSLPPWSPQGTLSCWTWVHNEWLFQLLQYVPPCFMAIVVKYSFEELSSLFVMVVPVGPFTASIWWCFSNLLHVYRFIAFQIISSEFLLYII